MLDIQKKILDATGKNVEVMVYGDGAFKDPQGKIWELADPVVSPFYTEGLKGTPNELKLKYLADNDFAALRGEELKAAIESESARKTMTLSAIWHPREQLPADSQTLSVLSATSQAARVIRELLSFSFRAISTTSQTNKNFKRQSPQKVRRLSFFAVCDIMSSGET